ncbi:MAG: Na/Pi cotransporter family protein [Lachnospiraceae bacterium]|nr:Na/Pi cotransporter family protein [Lachnospiraceae bacterium]
MDIFGWIAMLGGVALFLYGMNMLGDGLAAASGGKLEKILEKLAGNPIKAVLVGAGVTAVIQSSSATTVMVVGFVNSGIMKLSQAVGIIMGANIGTTMTAWILSLAEIEGTAFLLKLCKPTNFSPIMALIGIIIIMFSKKEKHRNIAEILIGFAILMYGMDTMSTSVEPLADDPTFTGLLVKFSNPILGLLAGLILTAIIQSSSASVGILQALAVSGAIGYSSVIPIIMGQNIGTCVTAMISSIGANKNAKRASLVHLYFNIIGTIIFMTVFYIVNAVVELPFMSELATASGIATLHSCFNIFATIILLPFSKGLVALATKTIKDDPEDKVKSRTDEVLGWLDSRFLETPSYAIEQSKKVADEMAKLSQEAIALALPLLDKYDETVAQRVVDLEREVDVFEDRLGTYLVQVSSKNLSEKDSQVVSELLHCIGDFERISDHARNLKEAAQEMAEKNLSFSEEASAELVQYRNAISDIIQITMDCFANDDLEMAKQVEPLEEVIDGISDEIKQRHIKRLREGKCTIELGFILSDVSTNLERISDHCSNIAVCLLEVHENEFDTHAYIKSLKKENNPEFIKMVDSYRKVYALPQK